MTTIVRTDDPIDYWPTDADVWECARCHFPLRAHSQPADGRTRSHSGHSLCDPCYQLRRRRLAGQPVESSYVPRSVLVDEYRHLRAAGVPIADIPGRLGMRPASFDRALLRARRAGLVA